MRHKGDFGFGHQQNSDDPNSDDHLIKMILDESARKEERERNRECLINRYYPLALQYARRLDSRVCQNNEAEALVNGVLMRVSDDRSLRTYPLNGTFDRRIMKSVKNGLIDWKRSEAKHDNLDSLNEQYESDDGIYELGDIVPDKEPTPEETVLGPGLVAQVNQFLDDKIPEPDRTIFRSRALMGISNAEVALLMDIPPDEVSRIYYRVKLALREYLVLA